MLWFHTNPSNYEVCFEKYISHKGNCLLTSRGRHNRHDGVSNHQPNDCLLNHLFRCRSKKTSKLRIAGLCAGNSPVTGEFPAQMASNAENVSISWCHDTCIYWNCLKLLWNHIHTQHQEITNFITFWKHNSWQGQYCKHDIVINNFTNTALRMLTSLNFQQLKMKFFNNIWSYLANISRKDIMSDRPRIFYFTFPEYKAVKPTSDFNLVPVDLLFILPNRHPQVLVSFLTHKKLKKKKTRVHIWHCSYRCPGAEAPGHQ